MGKTDASGRLITLEGGDGAGKSTLLPSLEKTIRKRGIETLCTREPGGTPMAEKIRGLLLTKNTEDLAELTELLLVFAARTQHYKTRIKPALDKGIWVLCDRFIDSSYAYQGGGRGVPESSIRRLEEETLQEMKPHLTLLLDVAPEIGLKRKNSQSNHCMEREPLKFHHQVCETYRRRAKLEPERIHLIDANVAADDVLRQSTQILGKFIDANT